MKNIYLVLSGLVIFLAGCSSTYTLKDYPSQKKYFKKLNSLSKGKNIKINFKNGMVINYSRGVKINDDSLFLIDYSTGNEKMTLPVNTVDNIEYQGTSNPFLSEIILKNGIHYTAKNMKIKNDSIHFVNLYKNNKAIPNWKITGICFNNRLQGLYYGLGIGIAAGLISAWIGAFPPYRYIGWDNYYSRRVRPYFLRLLVFPVIGAVLGYIIGHSYSFLLNP